MGDPAGSSDVADAPRKGHPPEAGARAALTLFVTLEAIALPLMLHWGHNIWFNADDWDFLAARKVGDLGDLMRPHFGHWTTIPVIAYRLTWWLVGIRTYTPYLFLVVASHLIVTALLRTVMRRSGVGPWLATLGAAVILFFGSGAENVLVSFQITFDAALAFGLCQLLLADHDGPLDRRDWLALLSGIAALLCSAVGLTTVAIVGLAVFLRRGWRPALFQTGPPALIFLVWNHTAPKGQSTAIWKATSPWAVVKFVLVGLDTTFARSSQLPGAGILLAALLLIWLLFARGPRAREALRGQAAAPVALLVGAIIFLLATGFFRSSQATLLGHAPAGASRAKLSRYVYVVAALALPAVTLAADRIIRRRPRLTVAVVAVMAIGIPGNIAQFSHYASTPTANAATRERFLVDAAIPLATQLPRSLRPQTRFAARRDDWLAPRRSEVGSCPRTDACDTRRCCNENAPLGAATGVDTSIRFVSRPPCSDRCHHAQGRRAHLGERDHPHRQRAGWRRPLDSSTPRADEERRCSGGPVAPPPRT